MASSLLFNWIAQYMYEGDAPLAERRAAALALDRDLLRELLGAEELRELLDPGVLADVELELQCLADGRRARSPDELHDVFRKVGDLTDVEVDARCEGAEGSTWLRELVRDRRVVAVGLGDGERYIAAEDAAAYRDAFGCSIPVGLPAAFTDPAPRPLERLVGRFARTRGPFLSDDVAVRFSTTAERADQAIGALVDDERVVRGEFRPGGVQREWCDVDVLRQLRRRSLAVLRREVEPVEQVTLARFLPAWHGLGGRDSGRRRGIDGLVETLGQLAGAPLVASTLERDVLPGRLGDYGPGMLDQLCTAGEVVWVGAGAIGSRDGRVRLCFADQLALLSPAWERADPPDGPLHHALRDLLARDGASFWGSVRGADPDATDTELIVALWDLVWAGEVTNDSLAPLRALLAGGGVIPAKRRSSRGGPPRPSRLTRLGPPAAAGRWSLISSLVDAVPSPTQIANAMAAQLLERYGVVTRETVLAEGVVGGYASVYPVLKILEERGRARRGYFVAGLGAAQFAVPGAVERLRAERDDRTGAAPASDVMALAATDPAQPYGAALAWPDTGGRPARTATALVLIDDGELVGWFDRSSHHLVTFSSTSADRRWADGLASLVHDGREAAVEVRKVNGEPPPVDVVDAFIERGFVQGYRGPVLRAARRRSG
jgi:ATP-dependent Lhr-like helicase